MNFNFISDKIVFSALKKIKHGRINLTNYDGSKLLFGIKKDLLSLIIKLA